MKRRLFLSLLPIFTLDPERLLWQPGKKLISIPAPTIDIIALVNQRIKDAEERLTKLLLADLSKFLFTPSPFFTHLREQMDGGNYIKSPLIYDSTLIGIEWDGND